MSSSQVTNIFQRGRYTTNHILYIYCIYIYNIYIYTHRYNWLIGQLLAGMCPGTSDIKWHRGHCLAPGTGTTRAWDKLPGAWGASEVMN